MISVKFSHEHCEQKVTNFGGHKGTDFGCFGGIFRRSMGREHEEFWWARSETTSVHWSEI